MQFVDSNFRELSDVWCPAQFGAGAGKCRKREEKQIGISSLAGAMQLERGIHTAETWNAKEAGEFLPPQRERIKRFGRQPTQMQAQASGMTGVPAA